MGGWDWDGIGMGLGWDGYHRSFKSTLGANSKMYDKFQVFSSFQRNNYLQENTPRKKMR